MVYTVIGEAVYPKAEGQQGKLREDLKGTLDYINNYYQEDLLAGFCLLDDGSVSGQLKSGAHLLEILDIILFRFTLTKIRFGIGIGKTPEASAGKGQEALHMLQEENDYQVSKVHILPDLPKDQTEWTGMVNASLNLCDYIHGRWKSLQSMIMEVTILKTGYGQPPKQTELADIFKTSKQNINRAIRGMGYYQYIRAKREIQKLLEEKWG